jgi:hypothetical protein
MAEYDELAVAAEKAGYEIFWLGPVAANEVKRLEELLEVALPRSFKKFLEDYGGGGVVSAEVSGIEENNASNQAGGTIFGDTKECRERYDLPNYLVVIYFHDDEVCWCLDTSQYSGDECPVVSYNIFTKKVDRVIAPDFASFIQQHLSLYGKKG